MSIEGKSVHVRLDEDIHHQLMVLAEYRDIDGAALARQFVTKMVVGEIHELTIATNRLQKLGLVGIHSASKG